MINQLLVSVANYISGLAQQIGQWAVNAGNSVATWIIGMVNSVRSAMESVLNGIRNMMNEVLNSFRIIMTNMFNSIAEMLNRAMAVINNTFFNLINSIAKFFNDLFARVSGWLQNVVNDVRGAITSAINVLKDLANSVINAVKGFITDVVTTVQGWISAALKFIADGYNAVVARINDGIKSLTAVATATVDKLTAQAANLQKEFVRVAEETIKEVLKMSGQASKDIGDSIRESFIPFVSKVPQGSLVQVTTRLRNLLTGQVGLPEYRNAISDIINMQATMFPELSAVFMIILTYSATSAAIGKLSDVYAQPIIQEIAAKAPYQIMSPIDIAAAWRRGFVDQATAVQVIRRQGYTEADAGVILQLADTAPSEFELIAMELRGIITPSVTNTALKLRGYGAEWHDRIRALGQVIPPVSDLILMAVREAFSPDVAARFGQFEDFPQDFAKWAQKQGLSEEWARRYWAAHWSLPSPNQGFEMFQRRIISEADLNLLLRALDIMPFWRDKMTQLAYNPLTRVDVRRMHQLGFLSDKDVYESYLDIGYSPQNAARLQEFTIGLNKGNQPLDDEELGRLTRTQVLNFYDSGLITREATLKYLTEMGLTVDAAILFVKNVDANEQLAVRKADADFIVEQAQAGILTFDEAQDKLNNMGLEAVEVKRAINKLVRLLASRTKLPTRSEAEAMLLKGIITIEVYQDLLGRLGYAEYWVHAYVALVGEKLNADRK